MSNPFSPNHRQPSLRVKVMSETPKASRGILQALLTVTGFGALAGVMVTAMITPALAVTSVSANSVIGVFDALPEFIEVGQQAQKNTLWASNTNDPADGYTAIAEVYWQDREEVSLDQMSPFLIGAAIAGEDRRFYEHRGVDVNSVVRAALGNVFSGDIESGASTLTMQLVKNTYIQRSQYLPDEAERQAAYQAAIATTFDRKLNEMKLAIGLEKQFDKDEIIEAYLNITGFGGNTYGVQSAARRYFGKTAAEVTPAEAASLMAIVQYPTTRNLGVPANYEANQARRDVILSNMLAEGYLTETQYQRAIAIPVNSSFVKLSPPTAGCLAAEEHARFFCDYVIKNVENFETLGASPEERNNRWRIGGLDVYTTLNLSLQTTAQDRVWELVPREDEVFQLGAAATSVEVTTGRVLTMSQNKLFNDSEEGGGVEATAVNFNTDLPYGGSSGFQVGSTYKIFALIAWLQRGFGLNEVVDASRLELDQANFLDTCDGPWVGPWQFKNSGSLEIPSVTVSQATVQSINSAFAAIAEQLDQCEIRMVAEALGVHRADEGILQTNPAAVLGTNEIAPLSMATAFAGIANAGVVCEPIVVDRFVTADGRTLPGQESTCRQGITADVAAAAAAPMRTVLTGGTGSRASPGGPVPIIGKTGTTDSQVHTWMVGSSTEVSTAVWVGNIVGDNRLSRYRNGGVLRHDIFRIIMEQANEQYGGEAFPAAPDRLLQGSGVSLPDITGQTVEEATILLENLGLKLELITGSPGSRISGFEPAAGTLLARGMTVRVISGDPDSTESSGNTVMPDLVGLSVIDANARMDGLNMDGARAYSCGEGSVGANPGDGTVTSQSMGAGTLVWNYVAVQLTVACGVTPTPVEEEFLD
jgi:membrane peptidoglycan carboxypeptidase